MPFFYWLVRLADSNKCPLITSVICGTPFRSSNQTLISFEFINNRFFLIRFYRDAKIDDTNFGIRTIQTNHESVCLQFFFFVWLLFRFSRHTVFMCGFYYLMTYLLLFSMSLSLSLSFSPFFLDVILYLILKPTSFFSIHFYFNFY